MTQIALIRYWLLLSLAAALMVSCGDPIPALLM